MIKIAFVGIGPWSRCVLDAYLNLLELRKVKGTTIPEFSLCGFWSESGAGAPETFLRSGAMKRYDTLEEILDDDTINVVEIGSMDTHHVAHAMQALDKGKHVSLMPPPAMNLKDLEKLIRHLKTCSKARTFRIPNVVNLASPFKNLVTRVKKRQFGTVHTLNISSFSHANPDDSLRGTLYSLVEYIEKFLGNVELVLGWVPEGETKMVNRTSLNCTFVPKNKAKHATWMHQYTPNLNVKNDVSATDFLVDIIASNAIAFAYGSFSGVFYASPISSTPGVYWCHKKDHEWKSDVDTEKLHFLTDNLEALNFLTSIRDGKLSTINYSGMKRTLMALVATEHSLQSEGSAIKTEEVFSSEI